MFLFCKLSNTSATDARVRTGFSFFFFFFFALYLYFLATAFRFPLFAATMANQPPTTLQDAEAANRYIKQTFLCFGFSPQTHVFPTFWWRTFLPAFVASSLPLCSAPFLRPFPPCAKSIPNAQFAFPAFLCASADEFAFPEHPLCASSFSCSWARSLKEHEKNKPANNFKERKTKDPS